MLQQWIWTSVYASICRYLYLVILAYFFINAVSHSAFSDLVSVSWVYITEKPEVLCPRRFLGVGLCKELCVNDVDCPNDEKCCSTKCGHECTHPFKVTEFGPYLICVSNQMCADNYSHDDQYPDRQKCCPTACGLACS
uniref:WAP domain-containing protein n=1 Tax=Cyprinus carpio TaxID=7962 RepID=A0A8C2EHS7_CYPCA